MGYNNNRLWIFLQHKYESGTFCVSVITVDCTKIAEMYHEAFFPQSSITYFIQVDTFLALYSLSHINALKSKMHF